MICRNRTIRLQQKKWLKAWGISLGYAYKLLCKLNKELADQGYVTVAGKIEGILGKEILREFPDCNVRGENVWHHTKMKKRNLVCFYYYEDWTGSQKEKSKRGFRTKKEALNFEAEIKEQQKLIWI